MATDRKRRSALPADLPETPEPDRAVGVPDYATAPEATRAAIEARIERLDMGDSGSILRFGSSAQEELQRISQSMLADVRNKQVGPAGESLRDMVSALRGFSTTELDMRRKRSLFDRLLGRATPISRFLAKFEDVQAQIDAISDDLLEHEHKLLKDIKSLDLLYDKTLSFHDELVLYIAAGQEMLRRIDEREIPAREAASDDVVAAQELRDLRSVRDDLERRVHDLRLTRQVTMQSLPSIRLVQENDKALVTKIDSTLVNTVPLWETQLAQAMTIQRSEEAADALRDASDLTNELLGANARNLRRANDKIRTETERGVFDIEAVQAANDELIATIEDSLSIAEEGRAARAEAEADLDRMEGDLRDALSNARTRDGLPRG